MSETCMDADGIVKPGFRGKDDAGHALGSW